MHAVGVTFGGVSKSEINGEFCRLRVKLDVQKPLRRGIFVSTENQSKSWISFKIWKFTYILFWLWKDGAWAHRLPRVYTFSTTDVGKILRIPLARTPHEDLLVWGGEHSGEFSIHSAYKLLQKSNEIPRAYPLQTNYGNFYKKLWRLNLPTKIKIIVWRISWNYFPKKVNMQHRKLVSSNYPWCGKRNETIDHIFRECLVTVEVWALWKLQNILMNPNMDFFIVDYLRLWIVHYMPEYTFLL